MKLDTWMYGLAIAALLMVSMRAFAFSYYFSGTFDQGLLQPIENTEGLPIYPLQNLTTLNPTHTVSYQSLTAFYAALLGIEANYYPLIFGSGTELGVLSREIVAALPRQYFIQAGEQSSTLVLGNFRIGLWLDKHNKLYLQPEAGITATNLSNYQSIFITQSLKEHENNTLTFGAVYGLALMLAHDDTNTHYFTKLKYLHIPPGEIHANRYHRTLKLHTHQLGMLRLVIGATI